jgi:hypothetical protein
MRRLSPSIVKAAVVVVEVIETQIVVEVEWRLVLEVPLAACRVDPDRPELTVIER